LTAINVQPDTVYGERQVNIRFTVDYDMSELAFKAAVYEAVKKGIAQWTRVNKRDTFLDKKGVKVRLSPFQGNTDLLQATPGSAPIDYRHRLLGEGLKDYVAEVWFQSPMDWVLKKEFRPVMTEKDGFMPHDKLADDVKAIVNAYEQSAATDVGD
jgi:hypothetical protein